MGVIPQRAYHSCRQLLEEMFGGSVEPAGKGTFLEVTMYPINAVIHPARLYTLLSSWREGHGDALKTNPLFYEDFTPEAAQCMDDVNEELINIGKSLTENGIAVQIPHIFNWLACYVYGEGKNDDVFIYHNIFAR